MKADCNLPILDRTYSYSKANRREAPQLSSPSNRHCYTPPRAPISKEQSLRIICTLPYVINISVIGETDNRHAIITRGSKFSSNVCNIYISVNDPNWQEAACLYVHQLPHLVKYTSRRCLVSRIHCSSKQLPSNLLVSPMLQFTKYTKNSEFPNGVVCTYLIASRRNLHYTPYAFAILIDFYQIKKTLNNYHYS